MDNILFTIDVGTRKMAAIVAEKLPDGKLKILGSSYRVHHDRALIDGQVEDIEETSKHIRILKEKLEERLGLQLKKVNLAVAGRGLRSVIVKDGITVEGDEITEDNMKSAILQTLITAQKTFPNAGLVGYSINTYYVDGYATASPKYRMGRTLEAEIVATFLPEQPVYALIKAAGLADLEVSFITLEPIAAITSTITPELRFFHLALVDIGGGTSDISISKEGKIVGYDVIPIAGDEITETLANKFLIPFTTAERIKIKLSTEEEVYTRDILGNKLIITRKDYLETIRPLIDKLTTEIAEKILSMGGDVPRAVVLVGGGSRTPLLREMLAQKLNLPVERVGIRFPLGRGFKILPRRMVDPAWAVAVGTTLLAKDHSGVPLIHVSINGIPVTLFSLSTPTVKEALARLGLSIKDFYGKPSPGTVITIDGKIFSFPGIMGSPPQLRVSGETASLDTPLKDGDFIEIIQGEDAPIKIITVEEVLKEAVPQVRVNGKPVNIDFSLLQKDGIEAQSIKDGSSYMLKPQTVGEIIKMLKPHYGTLTTENSLSENTMLVNIKSLNLTTVKEETRNTSPSMVSEKTESNNVIHIIAQGEHIDVPLQEGDIIASVLSKVPQLIAKLMKQGGTIAIYLNGKKAGYSTPLRPGDTLELKVQ